jgi:dipeptidyl aminopeptidase/acylaminoacyl peptidase
MRTHRASTSSAAISLTVASMLLALALALAACGGSGATASTPPATAPSEATVMVAASPSATPLPKGAGRGTIAFTKVTEDSMDIYVVRSDGKELRRLAADARGPAWSPDGSRIAYTSLSAGGVWVMNADGSEKQRVTSAPGGFDWVTWSPDGRRILFSTTAFSGADTLDVVNAGGGGVKTVFPRSPSSGGAGYAPAWAPDGRIFFGAGSGSLGEICSVDPGGRDLTVVTATPMPAGFSLSADGRWLAIWDGDSDRLVRMAASGRGMAVVLVEEVSQYFGHTAAVLSSWSPNGSKLVLGNDSRAWLVDGALYVAKTDGSEVWEVPNTAGAYDPAWRPE